MNRNAVSLLGLACLALSAGASFPAKAQDNSWNGKGVISAIGESDIRSMIQSLGHEVVENESTNPLLFSAKTETGFTYNILLTACTEQKNCRGARIQVIYRLEQGITDARINAANLRYSQITVASDRANNRFAITRYVIADHGITRDNLRANLTVFLRSVVPVLKIVKGEGGDS